MTLPSTGPLAISQINTELQRASNTTYNLNRRETEIIRGTSGTPILMSQLRGRGTYYKFAYTIQSSGTYYSGFFSGATTPALNPLTFFPLVTGDGFYVDTNHYGNWTASYKQSARHFCVYGTPMNYTWLGGADTYKANYYNFIYNGTNSITVRGYYAGSSTSFTGCESAIRLIRYNPGGPVSTNASLLNKTVADYNSTIWNLL